MSVARVTKSPQPIPPAEPCCLCERRDRIVYVTALNGRVFCGPCWRGEEPEPLEADAEEDAAGLAAVAAFLGAK